MPAKKKTSNTGHRLTAQQKNAIANAAPETTNTELAAKFETSLQTIAKYRTATAPRKGGRKSAAATEPAATTTTKAQKSRGGIHMDSEGEFIVLKIHKSHRDVVQGLVDQLLA